VLGLEAARELGERLGEGGGGQDGQPLVIAAAARCPSCATPQDTDVEEGATQALMVMRERLQRRLSLVSVAAGVAPLLGLLGIPSALLAANALALAYLLAFLRRRLGLSSPECWGLNLTTAKHLVGHGRALLKTARPVGAHG